MEFKYLAIGSELYGDVRDLDPGPDKHPHLRRKVTHTDTHTGIEYTFQSQELTNLLHGDQGADLDFTVKSTNNNKSKSFTNQRDLVVEFMKILGLAHECVPEVV